MLIGDLLIGPIPIPLYALIRALTIFFFIHWFNKALNKEIKYVFLIILFLANYWLISTFNFESLYPIFGNILMVYFYYRFNLQRQDMPSLLNILIPVIVPIIMTTVIQLYNLIMNEVLTWLAIVDYNQYMNLIDFTNNLIFLIISFILYKVIKHYFKRNITMTFNLFIAVVLMTLLFGSNLLICIYINYRPLALFNGLIIILTLILIYGYYTSLQKIQYQEIQEKIIEAKIEKNHLIYKNYEHEYEQISKLKHKIINQLKELDDSTDIKEYLHVIDNLISPIIHHFSLNDLLNKVLIEKTLIMNEKGITYDIKLWDHLLFLSDEEVMVIFGIVLDKIIEVLENCETKHFSLHVKSSGRNYIIIFSFSVPNHPVSFYELDNHLLYEEIKIKYSITDHLIIDDNHYSYSLNLVYKKENE